MSRPVFQPSLVKDPTPKFQAGDQDNLKQWVNWLKEVVTHPSPASWPKPPPKMSWNKKEEQAWTWSVLDLLSVPCWKTRAKNEFAWLSGDWDHLIQTMPSLWAWDKSMTVSEEPWLAQMLVMKQHYWMSHHPLLLAVHRHEPFTQHPQWVCKTNPLSVEPLTISEKILIRWTEEWSMVQDAYEQDEDKKAITTCLLDWLEAYVPPSSRAAVLFKQQVMSLEWFRHQEIWTSEELKLKQWAKQVEDVPVYRPLPWDSVSTFKNVGSQWMGQLEFGLWICACFPASFRRQQFRHQQANSLDPQSKGAQWLTLLGQLSEERSLLGGFSVPIDPKVWQKIKQNTLEDVFPQLEKILLNAKLDRRHLPGTSSMSSSSKRRL